MKQIKICGITTRAATSRVMLDNFSFLIQNGYKAYIVCEHDARLQKELEERKIEYIPIKIKSGIVGPCEVLKNIYVMYQIFRRENFDIIQYASSNASLYACIAGYFARIQKRILPQWGLTYLGFSGIKRSIFKLLEKLTCALSTNIQPDSHTNMRYAISEKLYDKEKANVIWNGSACGLNLNRFDITKKEQWRYEIRKELKIEDNAKVYGFIGRVVRDKGINELLEAFNIFTYTNEAKYLVVLGPLDGLDEIHPDLVKKSQSNDKIIFTGPRKDINKCYAALDFVVMPSYREGFSMVLLESAAMAIPVISSNINGSTDFVIENMTGLLFDVKSTNALVEALDKSYLLSSLDYKKLSSGAYEKAIVEFNQEDFNKYYLKDRNYLLGV